ncbi:MAG: acetate--CoA ligase family protein [Candidatus Diapherotrites archaeon]|uniref:Acetate--CoA ligase family protein n=1 Tax=Candidatus Iainarchaeum sp. TaxID=3101447 RepID=A0A8T4KVF1_9ARCH|nr:acetate--CoA ligase family protein [Candidatus Diapherotrites archaeon]
MVLLDLLESKALLERYGIKFAKGEFVKKEGELEKACKKIGFPLAMKIYSPKISHKTDIGGIKLNIQTLEEAKKAFSQLKRIPGFKGAYLQKMLSGTEIIMGGKRDAQFGPVVLFGLGGIYVELLKDVSMRVAPISAKDAEEMIKEIKGYALLSGARGKQKANLKKIKSYLLKVSKLMIKEKIAELDINPLFAFGNEVLAVDARVVK